MTIEPPITPKARRRWLQFSLRTLMVLVLIIGAGLGWVGMKLRRARAQREDVGEIEKLGGTVLYDRPFRQSDWQRDLFGADVVSHPDKVYFLKDRLADGDLPGLRAHLQRLPQVKELVFAEARITDAGLVEVAALPQLESLAFLKVHVTDAGLVHLQRLTQLRRLSLFASQVTDAGLVCLQELPQLRQLGLDDTQVTDAGLVHLRGLTRLERLYLACSACAGQAQLT